MPVDMSQPRSRAVTAGFVCAVVALFVSPILGFFLGLLAVLLGAFGLLKSTSPRTGGGIASLGVIALGVVAMIVKIIAGALHLIF